MVIENQNLVIIRKYNNPKITFLIEFGYSVQNQNKLNKQINSIQNNG